MVVNTGFSLRKPAGLKLPSRGLRAKKTPELGERGLASSKSLDKLRVPSRGRRPEREILGSISGELRQCEQSYTKGLRKINSASGPVSRSDLLTLKGQHSLLTKLREKYFLATKTADELGQLRQKKLQNPSTVATLEEWFQALGKITNFRRDMSSLPPDSVERQKIEDHLKANLVDLAQNPELPSRVVYREAYDVLNKLLNGNEKVHHKGNDPIKVLSMFGTQATEILATKAIRPEQRAVLGQTLERIASRVRGQTDPDFCRSAFCLHSDLRNLQAISDSLPTSVSSAARQSLSQAISAFQTKIDHTFSNMDAPARAAIQRYAKQLKRQGARNHGYYERQLTESFRRSVVASVT